MSQHIQKLINKFSLIFVSLAVAFAFAGCRDELLYNTTEIPDAEVDVEAEIIFRPLVKTEIETRADAPKDDAYKGINSLYVFFFDKDGALVKEYTGNIDNYSLVEENNLTHQRVKFKKRVQAGEYYVFAVANASHHHTDFANLRSISDLKNFKLTWDDLIDKDLEMFGVFKTTGADTEPDKVLNTDFEPNELIAITPQQNKIHSWVRRAVSKVTIDFDGSGLEENVTVYIKNAVLKDMPKSVLLGAESKVADKSDLGNSQYALNYGTGDTYTNWPSLTKTRTLTPPEAWRGKEFHDDAAMALPCYENMQGVHTDKCKYQDKNNDGIIDSIDKDGVELGTYLEVEGYYVSDRPEYKSQGKIIYRFMLGQNNKDDFNFMRNHHYKITMKFKGYGSDIDWHIVYQEKYLDVSYPQDVNYQGKFFTPATDFWSTHNAGHVFSDQNVISITSFSAGNTGDEKDWIAPSNISYSYLIWDEKTNNWAAAENATEMNWLSSPSITGVPAEGEKDSGQRNYTFKAAQSSSIGKTAADLFSSAVVGDQDNPVDLGAEDTANCYIVDSKGWYSFPLVYGNGETYTAGNTHFVNHLGNTITNSDIVATLGNLNNASAKLIWQDAKLVDNIILDKENNRIKFHISNIQEGNAVIALIDDNAANPDGDLQGTNTKAIWSWHIWGTPFFTEDIFSGQYQETIKVTNHSTQTYDVMPINLGWCSGGNTIYYHPPRKCEITFTFGTEEVKREIIQYPHMIMPRGDHPYYQWGRKDPFIGTNLAWGNKERWLGFDDSTKLGTGAENNPPRIYNEPEYVTGSGSTPTNSADKRKNTVDCLKVLVQNPDKWHNPTRAVDVPLWNSGSTNPFYSTNVSYSDLWSYNGKKTVYDPCPPGFQVGDESVFAGFVYQYGDYEKNPYCWYDVLERNMTYPEGYPFTEANVNCHVIEFYADSRKLQSITFPVSGYRDYDNKASVTSYYDPVNGTNHLNFNSIGFVWTSSAVDATNSYMLKFQRAPISGSDWTVRTTDKYNEMGIAPNQKFFNADGFAVRPVRIKK